MKIKSLITIVFGLSLCLCTESEDPAPSQTQTRSPGYTNRQASDCFSTIALEACQSSIAKCTKDESCKNELAFYQSCSFGASETDIFNGYCFRNWRKKALKTKDMIDCLVEKCNLEYNSKIGLKELYQCSKNTIAENFKECDEKCETELHKIRDGFGLYPIEELFQQEFEDQSAKKIVELIRINCIEGEEEEQKEETEDNKEETQQKEPQPQNEQL